MSGSGVVSISRSRNRKSEGFYFRVGHNDHVGLNRLIAERKLRADGLVLDARRHDRHEDLRQEAKHAGLATCLDTQAMELAMPGTTSKGHLDLPWAKERALLADDFSTDVSERFVHSITQRVAAGGYSEVIAPAHYLANADSDWIDVDRLLTQELRHQLDRARLEAVRIIYPLAVHSRSFYDATERAVFLGALNDLPIDAISLRVHPFGSDAGPIVMRRFIEACRDLRHLSIPLMATRAGIAAMSAFALNAVNLVESGITMGDSFDVGSLQKPPAPKKSSFSPPQRMYVAALGTSIQRDVAAKLLATSRGKLYFGCKDQSCCPNGFKDMLSDPERHSALARQRQFADLSNVPMTMRTEHFIHEMLSPTCDMLTRATDYDESFKPMQRRMVSLKETLLDLHRELKKPRLASITAHRRRSAQIIPLTPREPRGR